MLARRRAQLMIEDVVAALKFRITGRSVDEGRPAITVAFEAKPAVRPTTSGCRAAGVPCCSFGSSRSNYAVDWFDCQRMVGSKPPAP